MKTIYAAMTEEKIDAAQIRRAGEILRAGGLVAFPTETVYGLGGDAFNPESSRKIYAARQIALDLQNMGFNVVLNELSWNDYIQALEEGNYDIYYGEIKLTADFNLSALLGTDGGSNYFNRDATNYDSHIFNYLTASEENRAMQADLMCKYISEDAVMIPICFTMGEIMSSSGVVSDITASPYDLFYNIEAWSITLK